MTEKTKNTGRRDTLLRGGAILVLMAVIFIGIRWIGTERLRTFVDSLGVFGPVIYILMRALTSFVPFASGPLQLASGPLFGFWLATLYSTIGSTIGYSFSFWLARRYGRPMVQRMVGDSISRVDDQLERLDGPVGIIVARFVFYFAYDFVAYAVGLSRARYVVFVVITFVFGLFPTATNPVNTVNAVG
ncbi:MAG: VTT domain-containing protein, partial [Chloroflexota bacterium]